MNDQEKLDFYFQIIYKTIEYENDEIVNDIYTKANKLLLALHKQIILYICLEQANKVLYFISFQNLLSELVSKDLEILHIEYTTVLFLKKHLPLLDTLNSEKKITFFKILQTILLLDFTRQEYVRQNINKGSFILNNHKLEETNKLVSEIEQLLDSFVIDTPKRNRNKSEGKNEI